MVTQSKVALRGAISETKFGFMPELEWDGVVLTESVAITRFIAKKLNIAGKTDIQEAQCDAVVDVCSELIEGMTTNCGKDGLCHVPITTST